MSTWNELLNEFQRLGGSARDDWFNEKLEDGIARLSELRDGRNVLVYHSAFLQKPDVHPGHVMMLPEDLNGFMAAFNGMDWGKGLSILLHTPGGATMAVQSLVDYVRSKFDDVEVIVPTYAMSAGTMMALAADRVIMGNQSQLGPIDPQLAFGGFQHSARAIVEQFEEATRQILGDPTENRPANPDAAHVWAPVLGSLGPSLLQFAQNQLDFSESIVAGWLEEHMMATADDPRGEAARVAKFFNDASNHKSHDKRIGIEAARQVGVNVVKLEDDQDLQEAVLTLYHVLTILVEQTGVTKFISSGQRRNWVKNWVVQAPA